MFDMQTICNRPMSKFRSGIQWKLSKSFRKKPMENSNFSWKTTFTGCFFFSS